MEIIKRSLRRDVVAIAEDEMDAVDWNTVKYGCIYLDIWGDIHLELYHRGFLNGPHNTNWWHLFVRQDKLFKDLPYRMLKACKAKPASDLVGVRQFMYLRKERTLVPTNVGIYPWEYMKERGDEQRSEVVGMVRRNAFLLLFEMLDQVAERLGARVGYFPVATIDDEKMRHYGCEPLTGGTLWSRIVRSLISFPIRNIKPYVKFYPDVQPKRILSYLFVPASNRAFIQNLIQRDRWHPDWLIFDFEDAIRDPFDLENEGSLKTSARETLASFLPFPEDVARKYALRVNAVDSAAFEADIDFLERTSECPPLAVVLPKVESPEDVSALEKHLPEGVEIIPILESAKGLEHADEILKSSSRISAFCFGHIDHFFGEGTFPIPRTVGESEELKDIVAFLIGMARSLKKRYIDMGFYYKGRWDDLDLHCAFLAYAAQGDVELGKLVMHPDQIEHLKRVSLDPPAHDPLRDHKFVQPSFDEITAYAEIVVDAYEERSDKTSSVCRAGDIIVTSQVYLLAKKYLEK